MPDYRRNYRKVVGVGDRPLTCRGYRKKVRLQAELQTSGGGGGQTINMQGISEEGIRLQAELRKSEGVGTDH